MHRTIAAISAITLLLWRRDRDEVFFMPLVEDLPIGRLEGDISKTVAKPLTQSSLLSPQHPLLQERVGVRL